MAGAIAYVDFEFSEVVEPQVKLVCAAIYDPVKDVKKTFWLHNNPQEHSALVKYLKSFEIFIGYQCVAEARSFLALGLDPLKFKWIDCFLEYRMLTNHNDSLQWGKQLVDGVVKNVEKPKPKWERTEEAVSTGFRATHSLAEATYKLTGEIRDTKNKNKMRDLIISNPKTFSEEERSNILAYCMEDVVFLPQIWSSVKKEIKKLAPRLSNKKYVGECFSRGRYSAHTAIMEATGYPIDLDATRNFSKQVPFILLECQRDINSQFPKERPFKWEKKTCRYTWNQTATRDWIAKNHDVKKWMTTDTGKISLALEAFEKFYSYRHTYPEGNYGAQMVRFLKLKQSLYGFNDSGGKRKNFWDSVGSDGRVRPYLNIYGAQSSRSQPGASGFMFLKPAWMRALVVPKPGKFMAGIDYGQQEFLLSALESGDEDMIEAYMSGDPYLHTAKLCGAVPKDGKREDYKEARELFKNTTLGISYQMTKYGLAIKLTNDTGRKWSEDEAQEQIDTFYKAYPGLREWQEKIMEDYTEGYGIRLPCGWRMWCDNDNLRSVCNVPIQGCLHGDTRIPTKEFGFQKIRDLCGEKKINVWDGNRFQTADCLPSSEKEIVELHLSTGQIIRCSPEHKFLCVDNRGKETWKTPGKFGKQTFIRRSKQVGDFAAPRSVRKADKRVSHNSNNVSLKHFLGTDMELGELIGRLASDGSVDDKTGALWFIAEHEKSILQYLNSLVEKLTGSKRERRIDRSSSGRLPMHHINIYSTPLVKELQDLGIKESMKNPFLWSSKELLRGFLRGYVDGDGGVVGEDDRGSVCIAFGRGVNKREYAREMQKAFLIFGIETGLYSYSYRTNLRIRKVSLNKFISEIGFINKEKNKKCQRLLKLKRTRKLMGDIAVVKRVFFTGKKEPMYDIANCPNQRFVAEGLVTHNTGASVMRKAVDLAVSRGCKVVFTLHDAIYIEGDVGKEVDIAILYDAMLEAFQFYYTGSKYYEIAGKIKLDPFAWSPNYKKDSESEVQGKYCRIKYPCSNLYLDERALSEYERFSKYFSNPDAELL